MTQPPPVVTAGLLSAARALSMIAYTGVVFLLPRTMQDVLAALAEDITDRIVTAAIEAFPLPDPPTEEAS